MTRLRLLLSLLALSWSVATGTQAAQPSAREPLHWWKGNLHTHTFWSDGDDFPEMVAEWYQTNGYHFLALSDHNIIQRGTKWVAVTNAARRKVLEKYLARHGTNWVEQRTHTNGVGQARLKTLEEFRGLLEERDRFLTAVEACDARYANPVWNRLVRAIREAAREPR